MRPMVVLICESCRNPPADVDLNRLTVDGYFPKYQYLPDHQP
jgi:hypothetical protein